MSAIYERVFAAVSGVCPELRPQLRKELAWTYSFAVPSEAALAALAEHGPLVEIGAGTGYWAWRLQSRGTMVHAYDRTPGFPLWCEVGEGGIQKISTHPDAALLLCWPPLESPLASEALRAYRGQVLLFIGERGAGARTGDAEFHRLLEQEFEISEVVIPRWPGFRDSLWVARRRPVGALLNRK